jgi:hypothetical protein
LGGVGDERGCEIKKIMKDSASLAGAKGLKSIYSAIKDSVQKSYKIQAPGTVFYNKAKTDDLLRDIKTVLKDVEKSRRSNVVLDRLTQEISQPKGRQSLMGRLGELLNKAAKTRTALPARTSLGAAAKGGASLGRLGFALLPYYVGSTVLPSFISAADRKIKR